MSSTSLYYQRNTNPQVCFTALFFLFCFVFLFFDLLVLLLRVLLLALALVFLFFLFFITFFSVLKQDVSRTYSR